MPPTPAIPFIDLQAQRSRIGDRITAAIEAVLSHGQFILGPEVATFESRLAAFCGVGHAIGCASGTDALLLALMARGVGPGDAICVPAFSFPAAAEVVALLGATPVFADVTAADFNLSPDSLAAACETAEPRLSGVIPVDLFGQPAAYEAINAIAEKYGLFVLGDAAQSLGASLHGRRTGALAEVTATSFFPAKPLGCYGDGGAVLTDDEATAKLVRSLRMHGQGASKYDNVRIGINGRLDTLQAAILIEKLEIFGAEIVSREAVAQRYADGLSDVAAVPRVGAGASSVWAQYTLLLDNRDAVATRLRARGVPTAVHYPIPLDRQPAYREFPLAPGGAPVARRIAARVLSLPMHPYLEPATQDRIIEAVRAAIE